MPLTGWARFQSANNRGSASWTSVSSMADGESTAAAIIAPGDISHAVTGGSALAALIPDGATVTGLMFRRLWYTSGPIFVGDYVETNVKLQIAGSTASSTNKSKINLVPPVSAAGYSPTYGGSGDLWGWPSISKAQIAAANFGVVTDAALNDTPTLLAITEEEAQAEYILPTPPGSFTLSGPANGSKTTSTALTFSWTAAADAVDYVVEVSLDPAFGIVLFSQAVAGTSWSKAFLAPVYERPYYWRVTARNANGNTVATSAPFSLTIATPASYTRAGAHMLSSRKKYLDEA